MPMNHYNDTARALSEITDPGLFEHLATAVLRTARPDLYANLTQPGVNAEGKPIQSPVDAVAFVPGSKPPHMIAAHHTTQDDLRKKWLHDPSGVAPRKDARSTAPAGDLLKTADIVIEERTKTPDLCVTLALTTNEEPADGLTRDAERTAQSYGIVLDIWSRSRLAHFLDNDPNGQWLRRKYLGIEQERLSLELLRVLANKSLDAHEPKVRKAELVLRDDVQVVIEKLSRPISFLVGESGFGKSVACHQHLAQHVKDGGCGLFLPHEVLASSIVLDQAIDAALRQLHPSLMEGSGARARSLCSADSPLLIVVEDVSRSGQSALLIERLAKWAAGHGNNEKVSEPAWHLICPIWPELFGALSDDTRRHIGPLAAHVGRFTAEDAREAALKRAVREGVELSALDADVLTERLGYDPLLIGLCDFNSETGADRVISRFVAGGTERLAAGAGTRVATEYASSLRSLANAMLANRRVDPAWNEVLAWFSSSSDQISSLRELVKHGEIIRIVGSSHGTRLTFRHDRVYKWLLTDAIIHSIREGQLDDTTLSEPFFADVIGAAISDASVRPEMAERVLLSNPLALFHALHSFREPSAQVHDAVLTAIDSWLSDETSHTRANQSLRYAALHVLSDTQSSRVVPLLGRFSDRSWSGPLAGLRNGSLASAIRLCYSLEPGSGAEWRDRAIDHAKAHFGTALIRRLDELLRRPQLTELERVGGLRLAGHLAATSLAEAIELCWLSDGARRTRLDEYLWAIAQCGGEHSERLLSPVCDAWAALPDRGESEDRSSPRDNLAAHHVAWAFWRSLPAPALAYFLLRATKDDLRWQITYMLHGADHPDAVEFVAHELAKGTRMIEGTDKIFLFVNTVRDHWQRWQRERGTPMSQESRERLKGLWINDGNDKHLRQQSFRLWAAASYPSDLSLLRSLAPSDVLADDVLRARLERKDDTAIADFIERIRADEKGIWWWRARDIWSDALTSALDEQLSRRDGLIEHEWNVHSEGDWITSELVTRLPSTVAERLLIAHWEHLRFSPRFVQAALYTGTPRLLAMVAETISECPTAAKMFEHIDSHFRIRTFGHPGVTRIEQIEAMVPYLDHIDESAIYHFWELCNERGWIKLRREHLDGRLRKWRKNAGLDDATLLAELDRELAYERPAHLDFWVERHLDNGRSKENILGIVRQWLRSNKTPKALEVAASVIKHAGNRSDVDVLIEGDDQSDLAKEIMDDTRFSVCRRRLT